ncbi:MAG: biopolymer transporter ExbD [Pseudomonadota bacterium]
MAAAIPPRGAGRGRRAPLAEINVTPFVDVMLVLLIVFMVAAPLLTVGVQIELPETQAKSLPDAGEPITITVTSDGAIYLQETVVEEDQLIARLEAIAGAGYDQLIYVRGDKAASYGDVAAVMARINAAGYRRIGLVNDPAANR